MGRSYFVCIEVFCIQYSMKEHMFAIKELIDLWERGKMENRSRTTERR